MHASSQTPRRSTTFLLTMLFAVLPHCQSAATPEATPAEPRRGDTLVDLAVFHRATLGEGGKAAEKVALAVHFKVAKGWHIYWENPGEAGLPTRVQLDHPTSFRFDEPRYPAPIRFEAPGNVISYGYSGHTTLFVDGAYDPEEAPIQDDVPIKVKASWLVCKEVCLRGGGEASVAIPVGRVQERAADEVWPKVVMGDYARLPEQKLPKGVRLRWVEGDEGPVLRIDAAKAKALTFFPKKSEFAPTSHAGDLLVGKKGLSVSYTKPAPGAAVSAQGVLRFERGKKVRFFRIDLPYMPSKS